MPVTGAISVAKGVLSSGSTKLGYGSGSVEGSCLFSEGRSGVFECFVKMKKKKPPTSLLTSDCVDGPPPVEALYALYKMTSLR